MLDCMATFGASSSFGGSLTFGSPNKMFACNSPTVAIKRKHEDDDDCGISSKSRYYYVLDSESPLPTDEDEESANSIQNKSTDFCKDTSDTCTTYDVGTEYDVFSEPEDGHRMPTDTSSGSDEGLRAVVTTMQPFDAVERSVSDLADCSSSSADSIEFSKSSKFRTCAQCKEPNNNPLFRLCEKCFKVRKNFFPSRPRCHNRKQCKDAPLGSDKCREPAGPEGSSQAAAETNKTELCETCLVNPRNAVFVHDRSGHMFSCYKCAVKIWSRYGKCPICNIRAKTVIKIFSRVNSFSD